MKTLQSLRDAVASVKPGDYYCWNEHDGSAVEPTGMYDHVRVQYRTDERDSGIDWLEDLAGAIDWTTVLMWCFIPSWYLKPGTRCVVAKPWWCKQLESIPCEVSSCGMENLTVRPLEGNPHTRSVKWSDLVSVEGYE